MAVDPQQPGRGGSGEGPEYLDAPGPEPQDAPPPGYGSGYTQPGIPIGPVEPGPAAASEAAPTASDPADRRDDSGVHSQPTLTALSLDGQLPPGSGPLAGGPTGGQTGAPGAATPATPWSGSPVTPAAPVPGGSGQAPPGGTGHGQPYTGAVPPHAVAQPPHAAAHPPHAVAQPPLGVAQSPIGPGGPGAQSYLPGGPGAPLPAAVPGAPLGGSPGGYGYPPGPGGPYAVPYAPGPYYWPGALPAPPSNGMGTASLVTGLLSVLLFCLWPLSILLGVLAVIFGSVQRGKVRRGEGANAGHALAGIICGSVGATVAVTFLVLFILV